MYIYLKEKIPNVSFQCTEFHTLPDLVYGLRVLDTPYRLRLP